jgi:hypothetical protein
VLKRRCSRLTQRLPLNLVLAEEIVKQEVQAARGSGSAPALMQLITVGSLLAALAATAALRRQRPLWSASRRSFSGGGGCGGGGQPRPGGQHAAEVKVILVRRPTAQVVDAL